MNDDEELAPGGSRPFPAVVAIGLLFLVALGSLGFGALVLAAGSDIAAGGPAGTAMAIVTGASIVFGLLALTGIVGLWRGRPLGWISALSVASLGLLAVATSALSGAFPPQLLIAIALFGSLLALLLLPTVRRWSGIG